jgi:hypothetical protein
MRLAADDVQPLVIPDCGHWVAEQAPDELLAALTAFLDPYRRARPQCPVAPGSTGHQPSEDRDAALADPLTRA